MAVLAVAAISARLLAEAAVRDGFEVVALDLFGDVDTRRAATRWLPIGAATSTPRLDPGRVLDALRDLARCGAGEVLCWIAGSGFEGQPDLLAAGEKLLPLIGTAPADVRRVRDPQQFFAALAAFGIACPETQALAPDDADGWLSKDANGCGGWHICRAVSAEGGAPLPASRYFQRVMQGTPMSATFIANGREARLLGFNELIVRPVGSHPYGYCGCVGPVSVSAAVAAQVGDAVRRLAAHFRLRGWCSLDFIRDADRIGVLEVNPRPPASMALYATRGQIEAQLRACLHGELPPPGELAPACTGGSRIVYARSRLQLDAVGARRLAGWPNAHDLPAAGARFQVGDPICSLTAESDRVDRVAALLSAGHDALLDALNTSTSLDTPETAT